MGITSFFVRPDKALEEEIEQLKKMQSAFPRYGADLGLVINKIRDAEDLFLTKRATANEIASLQLHIDYLKRSIERDDKSAAKAHCGCIIKSVDEIYKKKAA